MFIFSILSSFVSIYAILCVLRLIFTWIPQANSSGFGKFLAAVCDPYLKLFRNIKWMRIGQIDFSPALGLGLLWAASALLGSFPGHGFSLSFLLQTLIGIVWNLVSSLISFLIIVFLVRLIVILVTKSEYSSNQLLNAVDSSLGQIAARISRIFFRGNVSYKKQLIVALAVLLVIQLLGWLVFSMICNVIGLIKI
ncbi:MAG: YggT family protein [Treponema sp.]|nr:YggT family protein [Treponema sp.]